MGYSQMRAATIMKSSSHVNAIFLLLLLSPTSCTQPPSPSWQGYFEGEYVYIAAPLSGRLEKLTVVKGTRVEAGDTLFSLEKTLEVAAQREANERLHQSRAKLEDLKKGLRPTEVTAIEARLSHARSVAKLSSLQLDRMKKLFDTKAVADEEWDRARLSDEANAKLVMELEAQLATANLGSRTDTIAAAEADTAAARAAVERADWSVNQKTQTAPQAGLVSDTLYRPGEYVPSGTPIVSLLPPGNIKIRFFVPEAALSSIRAGDLVTATVNGRPTPIGARVSYLSSQPEYTPPVLYNRDNRSKLVFMVEAVPSDPAVARDLHPGQPVDVNR